MTAYSEAYDIGFDAGYKKAVYRCFGHRDAPVLFETPEEYDAYDEGYSDGYNSVDD